MTASGKGSISATSTCLTGCYIHLVRPTTTRRRRTGVGCMHPHPHPSTHTLLSFFLSSFLSFFLSSFLSFPCPAHTHPTVTIRCAHLPHFSPKGRKKNTARCKQTNQQTNKPSTEISFLPDKWIVLLSQAQSPIPPAGGAVREPRVLAPRGGEGELRPGRKALVGSERVWVEKLDLRFRV